MRDDARKKAEGAMISLWQIALALNHLRNN